MKQEAISFTPKELALLADKEILPLKKLILDKLEVILTQLHVELKEEVGKNGVELPTYLLSNPGKISRGENFRSFSYRLLDYPSFFQKHDWLFYRSLVLWGHHISYHLMIKGEPLDELLSSKKLRHWIGESSVDIRVCLKEDPWNWIPAQEDEKPIETFEPGELEDVARSLGFLKMSRYLPLPDYDKLVEEGIATWKLWQKLLVTKNK